MVPIHDKHLPGESTQYREARDALLREEIALREKIEAVAAQRRALPHGGPLKEDYLFDDLPGGDPAQERQVRLSELFAPGKDTLVVYSLMYGPDWDGACPMCTSFLDSLDGAAQHLAQRVNLAVVAKAPIAKVQAWARGRGWRHLRLLSSGRNTYNADYLAEDAEGDQFPLMTVFRRTPQGIVHHYSTELFYAPAPEGMHPRHVDAMWPLWNVLDLTPEGRGTDWYPAPSYE